MKKNLMFLLLVTACTATLPVFAQTPYDSFEPEQAKKEMLIMPSASFQVVNPDKKGKYGTLTLDVNTMTINLMDSNNKILGSIKLNPNDSKWTSMDPLAEAYYSTSPYAYCLNNPIKNFDLDGCSTHTDSTGNVVEVYNDGDMGVYKHNIASADYDGDGLDSKDGTYMGDTENWDEFIDPETGKVMTDCGIQFGKSFDPIVNKMAKMAGNMDLMEIAANSAGGGAFDIKNKYGNVGGLLNNKYATSRSAGNYLAGLNASNGTILGRGISFDTFQKLAGALHVFEAAGLKLSTAEKINIVLTGKSYGPPPTYGEVYYQYRMSRDGWQSGK